MQYNTEGPYIYIYIYILNNQRTLKDPQAYISF